MDNTIIALQNLYVALGGEAADVAYINIIPDMINAIAEQVASNAAKATVEDNTDDETT